MFFPGTDVAGANQRVFRGVHSDIGGGYAATGLSNITLKWMIDEGKNAGVGFTNMWDNAPVNPYMKPHNTPWYYPVFSSRLAVGERLRFITSHDLNDRIGAAASGAAVWGII